MRRHVAGPRGAAVVLAAALLIGCGGDDDATGSTAVLPEVTTTSSSDGDPGSSTTSGAGEAPADPGPPVPVDDLSAAAVSLTEVARVEAPIALAVRPGTDVLYVAERAGRVRPIELVPAADGGTLATVGEVLVDVSTTTDGERGLLGLAFSPDGSLLYLSYTDDTGATRIDELAMDGETVAADSRRQVFGLDQPYSNHNGGHVAFGPDGHLYLGLGDGGGGGDPLGTGQDPTALLGSILRFDPADVTAAPEIWSYGVRNPWRFSWDRVTGELWIADVGQNAVEEVTLLPVDEDGTAGRGANLGWPIFEGHRPFAGEVPPDGYVAPVFNYEQGPGCSITGGVVSQGDALPALRGAYLYSDFCDPTLRAILVRDGAVVDERPLDVEVPGGQVVSFGEGPDGEVYVLSLAGGVYRLDPA